MEDMNSYLYGTMGPAYNAGQQMTLDQLGNTNKDLNNQTLQAQLPGVIGHSQSLAAQGQMDQTLAPDMMAAKKQSLMTQMDEDSLKQFSSMGDKLSYMGAILDKVPPMERPQAMQSIAGQFGFPANHPLLGMLSHIPPDQMSGAFQKLGQEMALSSKQALVSRQLEQDKNASQERIHKYDIDSRTSAMRDVATTNETKAENVARITSDSRIAAAKERTGAALNRMNLQQGITYLQMLPKRTPEEDDALQRLMKYDVGSKTAVANQTAGQLLAGSPIMTASDAAKNVVAAATPSPASPTPTPSPTTPQAPLPDISTKVKASGWNYEPDKYQYRIGPDGKVQRALK